MTRLLWLGLIPGLVAVAAAAFSACGSKLWVDRVRALIRQLEEARIDEKHGSVLQARFDSRELEGLPTPVQRYFRAALTEGQPIIAAVTIEMAGTFNMSATAEQWKPFTSWQRVVTRRPGFMWNARISMMRPGLAVRVVDSYIAGNGLLHAAMLGLFTVAKVEGGGEIARGEFMRFFAEAAWYPTAALHVARDQVIKVVLATPPALLTAASPEERARVNEMLDNILPVSARAEGLRADTAAGKHLAPVSLDSIRAPTLVISARDDGYGTYASAKYIAGQIATAKFIGFDQGGHTWVGHDAEVRAAILKLLLPLGGP
jgi:pimeloyl-ACP methyl ester carboxylesterase